MNHPSIPAADRAVYVACAGLEKALITLAALRRAIPGTLPIAAAEAHMADIETHLDALAQKLTDARQITNDRLDTIQRAEEAAAVDQDFVRWTHTLRKPMAVNDNAADLDAVL